jgi:hypothetical protein
VKPSQEIPDTLEELDESIITCTDTTSSLIDPGITKIGLKVQEIHTARRTSTPTKSAFAGGKGA